MKIKSVLAVFICLFLMMTGTTYAGVSNIVSFGDSLSDNGFEDGFGFGRYTDPYGTVWVENLARIYDDATLYDYAYGGATTGWGNVNPLVTPNVTGLAWQVNHTGIQSQISGLDLSDTLFTVWAGGNDASAGTMPDVAAANLVSALEVLSAMGAETILIPNLPDIGRTPSYFGSSGSAMASMFSQGFNTHLYNGLLNFVTQNPLVDIYYLDVYSIFYDIEPETLPWEILFADDGFHPSATGHWMIAQAAEDVLSGAPLSTPVPGAFVLMVSGLVFLTGFRKRTASSS